MNKEIFLATNNKGKLAEYREILAPLGFVIYSPKDLNLSLDPEENGATYRENSYIKAKAFAEILPFPVLADDSGLEIEALDGFPGLHSARFASSFPSYPDAWDEIFRRLENKQDRSAKFHCCICYLEHKDAKPLFFEADCPGSILPAPSGNNGFGYDPIFHSDEADIDFGLAPEEIKNAYSHRGKALKRLSLYFAIG